MPSQERHVIPFVAWPPCKFRISGAALSARAAALAQMRVIHV